MERHSAKTTTAEIAVKLVSTESSRRRYLPASTWTGGLGSRRSGIKALRRNRGGRSQGRYRQKPAMRTIRKQAVVNAATATLIKGAARLRARLRVVKVDLEGCVARLPTSEGREIVIISIGERWVVTRPPVQRNQTRHRQTADSVPPAGARTGLEHGALTEHDNDQAGHYHRQQLVPEGLLNLYHGGSAAPPQTCVRQEGAWATITGPTQLPPTGKGGEANFLFPVTFDSDRFEIAGNTSRSSGRPHWRYAT